MRAVASAAQLPVNSALGLDPVRNRISAREITLVRQEVRRFGDHSVALLRRHSILPVMLVSPAVLDDRNLRTAS